MKTMHEVSWHYDTDGAFFKCTVTPIKVSRIGVLPGCTGVSITATDVNGREFQGSIEDYYESEAVAWAFVRDELRQSIAETEQDIEHRHKYIAAMKSFLNTIQETKELNNDLRI